MIDPQLLEILVCPETKEPVEMAPDKLVAEINEAISAGKVVNRGGNKVAEKNTVARPFSDLSLKSSDGSRQRSLMSTSFRRRTIVVA